VFQCQFPRCKFVSCRLCGEGSHPSIARCEDVKGQVVEDARKKLEEAMSEARLRKVSELQTK
jgi:hypothetical protein